MRELSRRQFLAGSAVLAATAVTPAAAPAKNRIGLIQSSNRALRRPASPADPLDYARVRDMVWQAIEHAGGFAARVRPGSWLVLKPNLCFLRPQPGYRSGDIADFRVLEAVLEYVARNTRAGRVTIAEGGSYRGMRDSAADNVVSQDGTRVDATNFRWAADEFPGSGGTLTEMLERARAISRATQFDYVDLNYDGLRDTSGKLARVAVPNTPKGVGAFGARPDYFVTNTITHCDFLISIPVVKCHMQCGVTASLKNYVGTAPRLGYATPGQFWNANLHAEHSVEDRIDPFIADLSAFHPPDFVVADMIRGLQYREHNNDTPDQMIRTNLVLASRDPVAADALAAHLVGFNPEDIEYLHMAQAREVGNLDLGASDVRGDDPGKLATRWAKPADWHGRGNRLWTVTDRPEAPPERWKRYTAPTDTLAFGAAAGDAKSYAAGVRVIAEGHRKAFLWVGLKGKMSARLNGAEVMQAEGLTRYRVGQFRQAVELKPGENRLEFRVERLKDAPQLSVLLVGLRNDGDTVDGIRWAL